MHEFDGACHGDKTKLRKRYPLSKTNLLGLNGPQILCQALGRVKKYENRTKKYEKWSGQKYKIQCLKFPSIIRW